MQLFSMSGRAQVASRRDPNSRASREPQSIPLNTLFDYSSSSDSPNQKSLPGPTSLRSQPAAGAPSTSAHRIETPMATSKSRKMSQQRSMDIEDPHFSNPSAQRVNYSSPSVTSPQPAGRVSPDPSSVPMREQYRGFHQSSIHTPEEVTNGQRVTSGHYINQRSLSTPTNYTELPSIPRTTSTTSRYANQQSSSSYSPSGWGVDQVNILVNKALLSSPLLFPWVHIC